jgi:hypothetical protein
MDTKNCTVTSQHNTIKNNPNNVDQLTRIIQMYISPKYISSLFKSFLFLIICWVMILRKNQDDFTSLTEPEFQPLQLLKPSVIVYTSTSYHQEVAAALCCTLHDLGYDVVTYLPPKIDLENIRSFYGHCLHSWVLIGQQEYEIFNPRLLIFTTFLAMGSLDKASEKLIKRILAQEGSTTKFAGILHHSNVLTHRVPDFIPKERFTSIYLGEHTLLASRNITTDPTAIFIYPIPPITILDPKHSPPPPPHLRPLNSSLPRQLRSHLPDADPLAHFPVLVIQGNFGGVHSWRRDSHSLLLCLQETQKELNISGTTVHFIGFGKLNFTSNERDGLDLHHFSRLEKAQEFYRKIAEGNYLALTNLNEEYYSRRATSSIPTALLTGLPLITDQRLLQLYPCLRDLPSHKKLTKETFCETLDTVMRLPHSQWEKLVMEVNHCRKVFTKDAEKKFEILLSE